MKVIGEGTVFIPLLTAWCLILIYILIYLILAGKVLAPIGYASQGHALFS